MKAVDFLSEKKKAFRKKTKKRLTIQLITIVVLLIYSFLVVGVFVYYLVVQKEEKELKKEISKQEEIVEGLCSVEQKQAYLISKVKSLRSIFSSKKEYQSLVEAVYSLFSERVVISQFSIDAKGVVYFEAECGNFKTLMGLLKRLKGEEEFSGMKVEGVIVHGVDYQLIREETAANFHVKVSVLFIPKEV